MVRLMVERHIDGGIEERSSHFTEKQVHVDID